MGVAPSKSGTAVGQKMRATRPMTLRRLGLGLLFPRAKPVKKIVRHVSQLGPPGPQIGPDDQKVDQDEEPSNPSGGTVFKMFESAATTFASLFVLGAAGYGYHLYYKSLILRKINKAFEPGDPVLDLAQPTPSRPLRISADGSAATKDDDEHWIDRPEQAHIDDIISGKKRGRYYLIVGEKGTGKSSMILEAMRKIDGVNVSMFDAHADLEIFRIRLGKALNYEFHEDYIGSLFSVRGPRDTTALLDIERAFNKLEKVALRRREIDKHPLIIVVNCAHLIRDDDDGKDLLELIQQRAEQWAASNAVTVVFNSDEYWVYERLKRYATRMEILPVLDLPKHRAIAALQQYRGKYFPDQQLSHAQLEDVYDSVGGRLNYLSRVAKSSDMRHMCKTINDAEKTWFLNQCGLLGEEMDDDVMDQQKYASAAMVMAKALVDKEKENGGSYDPAKGHVLPEFPLYKARHIMTRADFIKAYDHENIFTIDSRAMVRADSVPMMNAFRDVCNEEGFEEFLEATLTRISAIESLNRTKEITLKDLWVEQSGELKGLYKALMKDTKGKETGSMEFSYIPPPEEEEPEKDQDK